MKSSFTFIRSAQNWESPGLLVTYVRDLEPRYLLRRSCCQMPSSLVSLNSHLLKRHLFWISKFIILRPPWSLGLQRILHVESLYFLLFPFPCQKNLDLKKLSFLRTSFGISKKQSIYTDSVGVYRQACSGIPLAVGFVGRDRRLWNSMVQGTQRFRQVRAASCVIPYVLCGGLYCLRC